MLSFQMVSELLADELPEMHQLNALHYLVQKWVWPCQLWIFPGIASKSEGYCTHNAVELIIVLDNADWFKDGNF